MYIETPILGKLIHLSPSRGNLFTFRGGEELSLSIRNPHFRETYSPIFFGVGVYTQVIKMIV